jgi:hypothetical protein
MREVTVKDTEGREWKRLVPETEEERRALARRTDVAVGGIDARDEWEDDDNWDD